MYSLDIYCDILIPYNFFFAICLSAKPSKYVTLSHSHIKLSKEFLLITTHEGLLDMSYPLSQVNYFLNKHH